MPFKREIWLKVSHLNIENWRKLKILFWNFASSWWAWEDHALLSISEQRDHALIWVGEDHTLISVGERTMLWYQFVRGPCFDISWWEDHALISVCEDHALISVGEDHALISVDEDHALILVGERIMFW